MEDAKYKPAGWPALIPRISVDDPQGLVTFIKHVFGATGDFHSQRPSELRVGDSMLMVGSTIDRSPMRAFLYIYVEDTDTVFRRALDCGADLIEEPQDMPYGDRRAMGRDAWGHVWEMATTRGQFSSS